VGHSMGVRSACALAHLKPGWVKGLVLVDLGLAGLAGGGLGGALEKCLRILPESFETRVLAQEFLETNCPDPSIAQYLLAVATIASPRSGPLRFAFQKQALLQTLQSAAQTEISSWIREAAGRGIRVLLLRGGASRVWSRKDYLAAQEMFSDSPKIQ